MHCVQSSDIEMHSIAIPACMSSCPIMWGLIDRMRIRRHSERRLQASVHPPGDGKRPDGNQSSGTFIRKHAKKASLYARHTTTSELIMRLTSAGQIGAVLRNNAGRSNTKLHLTGATYGVRSLTSGTYRVPKAFNEPNVGITRNTINFSRRRLTFS